MTWTRIENNLKTIFIFIFLDSKAYDATWKAEKSVFIHTVNATDQTKGNPKK